jgi:hypothetical protein
MPLNKRFHLFIVVVTALATIAGCGGGGKVTFPTPQGAFTNANLSGPFAFSYTGSDAGGFLAVAGSFVADGAGHITSGTQDINSGAGISTNVASSGTYLVRSDGRGTITLNSPAGNSTLDFVIVAGGHALVTPFPTPRWLAPSLSHYQASTRMRQFLSRWVEFLPLTLLARSLLASTIPMTTAW